MDALSNYCPHQLLNILNGNPKEISSKNKSTQLPQNLKLSGQGCHFILSCQNIKFSYDFRSELLGKFQLGSEVSVSQVDKDIVTKIYSPKQLNNIVTKVYLLKARSNSVNTVMTSIQNNRVSFI